MKKDKLYKVNKYNKNLFAYGDPVETRTNIMSSHSGPSWGDISAQVTGNVNTAGNNGSGNTEGTKKNNIAADILGAVSTAVSPALTGIIGGGYSTNGVGAKIAATGNMAGEVAGEIPVIETIATPIVKIATAIGGGLYDRAFGVKENKGNIATLDSNTAAATAMGRTLANSITSDEYIKNAGNMVNSLGFTWDDLYENGWATNEGTKRGNKKLNINKAAQAFQTHGLATGADNVDAYQDSNTMSTFKFEEGGFLPIVNTNNMGAIEYGFMNDYLSNQRRKAENKNLTGNMFAGMPSMFAIGGGLQSHGTEWPISTHIDAGGSHEENPNEGVQLGVDQEGTPNLVEEGEVIFNDYVFSNRIEVPKEAQKWLGVKGRNLTFAEASKQLEKEIKERPNDPVSRAALKAQMERLEEEQEFVKRCTSYSVGEVYDVDNNEMSLLNHNGYEYEKLG